MVEKKGKKKKKAKVVRRIIKSSGNVCVNC